MSKIAFITFICTVLAWAGYFVYTEPVQMDVVVQGVYPLDLDRHLDTLVGVDRHFVGEVTKNGNPVWVARIQTDNIFSAIKMKNSILASEKNNFLATRVTFNYPVFYLGLLSYD